MTQRNENYTRGTLRRPLPQCYVDDLCVWGVRVIGLMVCAAGVLWAVGVI